MKRLSGLVPRLRLLARGFGIAGMSLALAVPAFAQGNSPWENAVNVLQLAFTSTIARGLSLVAIVVSGLTFAFGEGGSKRVLAGSVRRGHGHCRRQFPRLVVPGLTGRAR
jgi:type IV secretory pathway VirB2 component (pilin)